MAYARHQRCNLRTLLLLLIGTCSLICESSGTRPHIVVILADDFGWSDVSYRDPEMYTPNIDKMIRNGVHMTSSYMNQVCSPSRAAFLSGRYPFKLGLQHSVLTALKNGSMPVNVKLLPEHLKELGYATSYVGKWHLGFCNVKMTPTNRGFDLFYGMYNGMGDYYTHKGKFRGYDMHNDTGKDPRNFLVSTEDEGKYSTNLFTEKTVTILENHDMSKPLFHVLSFQAVHGPLQVPDHYIDEYCPGVTDKTRQLHCAMSAAMDEGIGNITSALKRLGYWDNLITIFMSDNGGATPKGSSNWPFRGAKITLWEGGTRVVTTMHSETHLPDAPYEWNGLMHAIDWYPTLMKAAGYETPITGIDGVNNWDSIKGQGASMRTEFVYNIDEVKNTSAIRVGNYKMYRNPGKPDGWYYPPKGVTPYPAPKKNDRHPVMLIDLENDPSERTNLIEDSSLADVVKSLSSKLDNYAKDLVPTREAPKIKLGKPNDKRNNRAWITGWC